MSDKPIPKAYGVGFLFVVAAMIALVVAAWGIHWTVGCFVLGLALLFNGMVILKMAEAKEKKQKGDRP